MNATRLRRLMLISMLTSACGGTDPAIQVAVDKALLADTSTAPVSLDISVNRRVVRLTGEVASRDQERRIVAVARSVRGVKDVIDAMYLGDAAVVDAVKQALRADPLVGRIPIEVDGSRGNIRLISDQTGPDDRKRAIAIAAQIDGVKQVEDRMR